MADESTATQLPLFEEFEFLTRKGEVLPTKFKMAQASLGTEVLVDLDGVDLRLMTPYEHREMKIQQDMNRKDKIEILARLSGKSFEEVWVAYIYFCNGDLRIEVLEHFVDTFKKANVDKRLRWWLDDVKRDATSKPKQAKRVEERRANGFLHRI